MQKQPPVPTRTDASGSIHTLRRAPDGAELAPDERRALLAEVRGNPASTAELAIVATVYRQSDTPNRGNVRFSSAALAPVCASFVGAPFLRDHEQQDMLARGGKVLAADLVTAPDGAQAFQLAIQLVKPWAIEAALDGTLDRFSIGWRATGPVTCTACGAAFERGFFGGLAPSCDHVLGETYDVNGAKVTAQAEFSSAEGVECSAVSVPAVSGTSVDAIRAALAAHDAFDPGALTAALSLAPSDGEQVVRAAFEELHGELAAARAGERTAREQLQAFQVQAVVDEAVRTGKLRPKDASLEGVLRTMATTSLDGVRAYVASLPRISPVNLPLVSAGPDPTREHVAISERQKHVNELMGVTEEAFARAQRKENSHE